MRLPSLSDHGGAVADRPTRPCCDSRNDEPFQLSFRELDVVRWGWTERNATTADIYAQAESAIAILLLINQRVEIVQINFLISEVGVIGSAGGERDEGHETFGDPGAHRPARDITVFRGFSDADQAPLRPLHARFWVYRTGLGNHDSSYPQPPGCRFDFCSPSRPPPSRPS